MNINIYIRPPKSKPNFCPTPAESGPTPAESGPTPAESGPTPAESGPTPAESGPTPAESGATPAESGATLAESGDSVWNQWGTEKYCLVVSENGQGCNGEGMEKMVNGSFCS